MAFYGILPAGGWMKKMVRGAMAGAALAAAAGCMMMGNGMARPADAEFGMGPRVSASGRYSATIEAPEPLRVRRMQTVRVTVRTAAGAPVDGAQITIDGGMPQHGHGLPTAPRVTRALGNGAYQVEGLKFNMGGWWELKFRISSTAGPDSVTFNLDL
ncbi:MAG TPA: FixH family protein [Longimicrobium sp.]|nr:FixH family protein [Longimicrobium sp.]